MAVLASNPASSSRLPGPLRTCAQCLILAFLFSGLGFAGFSAMAKPVLPENSLWKLPFGWDWAPGEASTQLSGGGGRQGLRRGSGPAVVGRTRGPLRAFSQPLLFLLARLLFQGPSPCFPAPWTVGAWLREAAKACSPSSPALDALLRMRERWPPSPGFGLRMGRPTHGEGVPVAACRFWGFLGLLLGLTLADPPLPKPRLPFRIRHSACLGPHARWERGAHEKHNPGFESGIRAHGLAEAGTGVTGATETIPRGEALSVSASRSGPDHAFLCPHRPPPPRGAFTAVRIKASVLHLSSVSFLKK